MIEITRVSKDKVWNAWVTAHAAHGQSDLVSGAKGEMKGKGKKGIAYRILDVVPGKSFSILWKTLFVRLIFHYSVRPLDRGSEVRYDFCIKGIFAYPVRFLLENKIRKNLAAVLKAFVAQLEAR